MPTMISVQFFIPVSDNAGRLFTPQHDARFEAELVGWFGGFSCLPGLVAGGWVDGGVLYKDQSRVYEVFVRGLVRDGRKVRAAARFAKGHYQQLKITVRYLDQAEIL